MIDWILLLSLFMSRNDIFPDTTTLLVTLQIAVHVTTANKSQQQQEVTTCDGLQESNHITVPPQNKKGNVCRYQTRCKAHNVLFVQQKPCYTYSAISSPLVKFHQFRIKHTNFFPLFQNNFQKLFNYMCMLNSEWMNHASHMKLTIRFSICYCAEVQRQN